MVPCVFNRPAVLRHQDRRLAAFLLFPALPTAQPYNSSPRPSWRAAWWGRSQHRACTTSAWPRPQPQPQPQPQPRALHVGVSPPQQRPTPRLRPDRLARHRVGAPPIRRHRSQIFMHRGRKILTTGAPIARRGPQHRRSRSRSSRCKASPRQTKRCGSGFWIETVGQPVCRRATGGGRPRWAARRRDRCSASWTRPASIGQARSTRPGRANQRDGRDEATEPR